MKRPRGTADGESGDEETDGGKADEKRPRPDGDRPSGRSARRSLAARVSGEKPPAEAKVLKGTSARGQKAEKRDQAGKAGPPKPEREAKEVPEQASRPEGRPRRSKQASKPEGEKSNAKRSPKRATRARSSAAKSSPTARSKQARKRQRSETPGRRRKRGDARRRARGWARSTGSALRRGGIATRKQVATSAPKAGNRILATLGAFYAVFFTILGRAVGVVIAVGRVLLRPLRSAATILLRIVNGASRIATPTLVLALVVAGAAILLALSQYADYRSITIGNGAYAGVQAIAPAPETARVQTGDPHSYIFVPIAIGCLLLLAGALTGRWRLCRVISLAGVAAIVVSLVVDRPAGLDTGDLAAAFEGVRATLIGGFYAQIAAGLVLVASSSLLARELRLAGATAPEPEAAEADPRGSRKPPRERSLRTPPADAGSARA